MQVFTAKGEFLNQWPGIWRAAGAGHGRRRQFLCGRNAPTRIHSGRAQLGPQRQYLRQDRQPSDPIRRSFPRGGSPGRFTAPHGIAVDAHGDLYVCEMPQANMGPEWMQDAMSRHKPEQGPAVRTIVKLARTQ